MAAAVVVVVVEEEEEEVGLGREESGVRAKRCLAFVRTMDWSSGKVTAREEMRGQESWQGVSLEF